MTHDVAVTSPPIRPTGRSNKRLRQTVFDMVLSLAVVFAVIALVLLVTRRPQPDPVRVVETAPVVALAGAQAEFPVLEPTGLSAQWRPTSARWEPTEESGDEPVLHIGYVTPNDQYAQVSQVRESDDEYLSEQTTDGVMSGQVEIAGEPWETWTGDKRRSLVRVTPESTVVVSGTANWAELTMLAQSLKPAATP